MLLGYMKMETEEEVTKLKDICFKDFVDVFQLVDFNFEEANFTFSNKLSNPSLGRIDIFLHLQSGYKYLMSIDKS